MAFDMTKHAGRRKEGRDYSKALADLLPDMLKAKPMTKREIEAAAGRDHATVTKALEKVAGSIYIAEWVRGKSGPITPRWAWGNKPNAPRPQPYTGAEKSKRYRDTEHGRETTKRAQRRWKKSSNGRIRTRLTDAAAYARKKIKAEGIDAVLKRDRVMFALFGGGRSQPVAENG